MKIDRITIYKASFPLLFGYELSFGTVRDFKSVIVRISSGDKSGWGESTPLPGYTGDTVDSVHARTEKVLANMIGMDAHEALKSVEAGMGFASSPVNVALEMLTGMITPAAPTRNVPIAHLLKSRSPDLLAEDIRSAYDRGYTVFKLKIGGSPSGDALTANAVIENLPSDAKVRFDANQGYSFKDALTFMEALRSWDGVELIEQPLRTSEWEDTKKLAERSAAPIMLDESIMTDEDILKTAHMKCAGIVKLKLFKCGGYGKLKRMAKLALDNGLGVVIGNGVSTGFGCLLEAKAWDETRGMSLAGEMNGFLKMKEDLMKYLSGGDRGFIKYAGRNLPAGIDEDVLEKYSLNKKEIGS